MRNGMAVWLALLGLAMWSAAPAGAEGKWAKDHPRRHEVNKRLRNQNNRVKEGVEDGKLTKQQAGQIHKEDRAIRHEERVDAAKNGGHITKAEQRKLNRQENRVSRQINRDESGNAAGGATGAPATTGGTTGAPATPPSGN